MQFFDSALHTVKNQQQIKTELTQLAITSKLHISMATNIVNCYKEVYQHLNFFKLDSFNGKNLKSAQTFQSYLVFVFSNKLVFQNKFKH